MVSVILAVVLALCSITAEAATYYVATTGSNGNSGAEDAPWATIAHAVTTMVAGDTTYVRGGTYNSGEILFSKTGTVSAPIKLLNYPNETPVINFTASTATYRILIQNALGYNVAMGYITIEGFEIRNGFEVKAYNIHDSVFRNNYVHHMVGQGFLIQGSARLLIEKNIIALNGPISTNPTSPFEHGIYGNGSDMKILNNVFYGNTGFGVQQNGSSSSIYSSTKHAGPEFALATGWIIANNTFAYNGRAGQVVWGSGCLNARIENNIYYENGVNGTSGDTQGIHCTSCSSATGIGIKNNHAYATAPGSLTFQTTGFHAGTVVSGNVVNISAPSFVAGGSGTLPGSPDFRLTASAPVNICRLNEFPNNSTCVVGAYKTVGTPTASMTTNKITVVMPMSAAVPIQNLSTAGVSISCPSTVCPGSPVVASVSRSTLVDSNVEVLLSGITSDACLSHADPVTISYASASGTWTGNDNIGPYPGSHQQIFSSTNLPVTNNCTGSGPTGYPGGALQYLTLDGNANDSSGNANHATATGGSYVAARTGQGFQTTNGATDRIDLNYGAGIDLSTTSFTLVFGVEVTTPSATRTYAGSDLGVNQRFHVGTLNSTWGLGIQSSALTTTSDLAVTAGHHQVVLQVDSATDTATLCVDGVSATTGSGVKSFTSYTLASDISVGLPINFSAANGPTAVFDEVRRYSGVVSCSSIYAGWNASAPAPAGTLKQDAIQFNGVVTDTAGSPIVLGPSVKTISVPWLGGVVLLFQVLCQPGADCGQTAFKLVAAKNGAGVWQQVTDTNVFGTWMWGTTTEANLNVGARSTRLEGSCAVITGATQLTADQVPSLAIPQTWCTVLGYVVRVDGTAGVDYYEYKVQTAAGQDLPGGYDEIARINVVNPMSSGVGF